MTRPDDPPATLEGMDLRADRTLIDGPDTTNARRVGSSLWIDGRPVRPASARSFEENVLELLDDLEDRLIAAGLTYADAPSAVTPGQLHLLVAGHALLRLPNGGFIDVMQGHPHLVARLAATARTVGAHAHAELFDAFLARLPDGALRDEASQQAACEHMATNEREWIDRADDRFAELESQDRGEAALSAHVWRYVVANRGEFVRG